MVDLSHLTRRQWLSAAGLLALAGCGKSASKEPIWIGHLGRLSGAGHDAGEMAVSAMQSTLADLRAREVTIAGRTLGVRHIDASSKERARAEASRLLAVNHVVCLVVGPGVPDVGDIVAIGRSHGAAVIVLEEVTDATLADQAVLLGPDPLDRGERLARYAVAQGKKKRALILRDPKEISANRVADAFAREFARAGGAVTNVSIDKLQLFDAAKDIKEEVILTTVPEDRLQHPRRDFSKPDLPIILCGLIVTTPKWLEELGYEGEFWWPTLTPEPASFPAEGKAWAERFAKQFSSQPSIKALLAHDAIAVIADGLQAIGSDDRGKLADHLAGRTEFMGLTGTISRKEGRPIRPLFLMRFVKGRRLPTVPLPS